MTKIEQLREQLHELREAKKILDKRICKLRIELEKSEEVEEAERRESESSKFTGIWRELYDSGMKPRLITILQNREKTCREIGDICGVSAGQISHQKHDAYRRLRHPSKKGIAERLGISIEPYEP